MTERRRPTRRASAATGAGSSAAAKPSDRVAHLVALIDHCTAAQTLADGMEDKFLSYMLAMTIQEARLALQRDN